jgi:hypothetical protein
MEAPGVFLSSLVAVSNVLRKILSKVEIPDILNVIVE